MTRKNKDFHWYKCKASSPPAEQLQLVRHRSDPTVERLIRHYGNDRTQMDLIKRNNVIIEFPGLTCSSLPCPCPYGLKEHKVDFCPLSVRPRNWVMKRHKFISTEDQALLWTAYHDLINSHPGLLKPPKPVHSGSKGAARELLEAASEEESPITHYHSARSTRHCPLHLGYWRRSSGKIALTADTLQHGNYERQLAIFKFLAVLDKVLFKNQWKVREMDPKALHADAVVSTTALAREFKDLSLPALETVKNQSDKKVYPLSFGWMGTTVAVATGYSELYHIDYNDYNHGGCYSFSFSVSPPDRKCEVEIHFPMLRARLPYKSGQLFAFQAGDQLHRVLRKEDGVADHLDRLNFTIFTDMNTGKDIMRKRQTVPVVEVPRTSKKVRS